MQKIRDAFAKVKTKKFGVGSISSFFLEFALPSNEISLALLFKTLMETNTFPELWKIASSETETRLISQICLTGHC